MWGLCFIFLFPVHEIIRFVRACLCSYCYFKINIIFVQHIVINVMNFFICCEIIKNVATLLWPSVGVKPNMEKVRIWSPPGLPNVQSSTARPKTPHIEVFLVSLERSWSVDIENGLALVIWTSVAQVMGKRRARNRPLLDLRIESAIRRWKDLGEGYKFGLDLVTIRLCSRELWAPKVPRLHPGQFRDNFRTLTLESREKVTFRRGCRGESQSIL
jgi:hypothetical protein